MVCHFSIHTIRTDCNMDYKDHYSAGVLDNSRLFPATDVKLGLFTNSFTSRGSVVLHTQRNDYKVYIKKKKSKILALFKLTVERRLKLDKPTIAIFCVLVNVSS